MPVPYDKGEARKIIAHLIRSGSRPLEQAPAHRAAVFFTSRLDDFG
jgi:hypothetical protein